MPKAHPAKRSHAAAIPALSWLADDPSGARLMRTAHRLLAAQAALEQVLPRPLAAHVRVARIHGPQMTVVVPGPAYAARLRQLATQATEHLAEAGWPIRQIVVRIDAAMRPIEAPKPRRMARGLDARALQSFRDLQQAIAPGPLAQAITRLLRHHAGPRGPNGDGGS